VDTLALEEDFRIVAQASDGSEAIDKIRELKPNVAILDVNMPGLNGQQVTHQVTSEHLPTRVVLLTGYDDIEQAIHAVLAGAVGYCEKEIEPETLAPAGNWIIGSMNKWTERGDRTVSRVHLSIHSPTVKWKCCPAWYAG
jgi:DNA-binding NarL/FixJ family response regulator